VGRPNVGKSSLLNALVGKRVSIVQDMPGVTRDRVSMPLEIGGRYLELVDTGGYGFVDPDALTDHIKHQIELAMARADMVLFIVDCSDGLTAADEEIAALLRRQGIKTVLVANKADSPKADVALGDFARLGLGPPLGVSALRDRNLDELLNVIRKNVDLSHAPTEMPKPQTLMAIVGKRNAGKSTLVNSIAELFDGQGDRVIVSEVPGTTRDSIDVRFEKEGKTLIVIDTAGVRKKRHMVTNDIEFYSFHRAERSIRRADVVLMLIDGMEPVSEPDKKLSQYIAEQYKPVILVVNKWDKVLENARQQAEERKTGFSPDLLMEEYGQYLSQELRHLDYAPVAFITAKDGKNVQAVLDTAQHLYNQANIRLNTGKLNRAVRTILEERHPSTPTGRRAKIFYATQTDVAPPTIVLFVNNPDFVNEVYQRFMINRFRELLPYPEVPIKLLVRGRAQGGRGGALSLDEMSEDDAAHGAGGVTHAPRKKPTPRAKRPPEPKPRPKKTTGKGPKRGRRPHR
jgi:GTP-binding protein